MIKIILFFVFCFTLTGCLKIEVKPEHVVSDTVDAGKELYETIKRKNDGKEERAYSHSVMALNESVDSKTISECKRLVVSDIKASTKKLSKILSESSEVISADSKRKIKCTIVALVKP